MRSWGLGGAVVLVSLVSAAACSSSAPTPLLVVDAAADDALPDAGVHADAAGLDGALSDGETPNDTGVRFTRVFPSAEHPAPRFEGCVFASPLHDSVRDRVLLASADGKIAAIDPRTGQTVAALQLPAEEGSVAFVTATPVIVGDDLVVAFHTRPESLGRGPNVNDRRLHQRVAVVSLATMQLNPEFPVLELTASLPASSGANVEFLPSNSLSRGALAHGVPAGATRGRVYVTFGNARDIQPWHGWAFEVDLDAWHSSGVGAAMSSVLVSTPETQCGAPGSSGSRSRVCGGGMWSPAGPLLLPTADGYEVLLPTGNGQLDLTRRDYANSLMRVAPGMQFDAACDPVACAGQSTDPDAACLASCRNLYVPRLEVGDVLAPPESGVCEGLGLYDCWAKLDFQGGSTPVRVVSPAGVEAIAYASKDGQVYLADRTNLGTQYDRLHLVDICGTLDDKCSMDWAGMIVTQPAVASNGTVVVPTFMPDKSHLAGVFGLTVRDDVSGPKLDVAWRFPRSDAEALTRFRRHSSLPVVARGGSPERELVFLVDLRANREGSLVALDPRDGSAAETPLVGAGIRFSRPLWVRDTLFVGSCESDNDGGSLEAYRVDF